MASNKEIVGWFTRGGKRVPIFKGEGKTKARRARREETLKYDHETAKKYEGLFDVASPQETANAFGKSVKARDGKTYTPKKRVRRGEGKLTPYYYDSELGQYHTGEKFNSDAVKADIKEQTRSKTTEHTTTRKARVRSARRKKDGR